MAASEQANHVESTGEQMMLKAMADRLEIWDIGRLIPSARNARTHSDGQIAEIAGSIAAFGFMVPVLADSAGVIIAGHGRVLAARQLKLDRVPVIVVDHLTDAEKRAYAIADNKIALNADWDEDLLRVELEALKNDGVDLEILGFSEDEFNHLMDQLGSDARPDEDSVPESPISPISCSGDLWQLGEHQLYCGDATEAASYSAVLAGEPADMLFSDPVLAWAMGNVVAKKDAKDNVYPRKTRDENKIDPAVALIANMSRQLRVVEPISVYASLDRIVI